MSDPKKSPNVVDAVVLEKAESKPAKKKDEPKKTVYTHGKKFKIPVSQNVDAFLREKYPEEYRKEVK